MLKDIQMPEKKLPEEMGTELGAEMETEEEMETEMETEIGAEEVQLNPKLSKFTDDELMAEVTARGLGGM